MTKKKSGQPARGSVADANAEKITALEKRNRVLEGDVDTYKTEIDQITTELESIRATLVAKDRRIISLGGLVN